MLMRQSVRCDYFTYERSTAGRFIMVDAILGKVRKGEGGGKDDVGRGQGFIAVSP